MDINCILSDCSPWMEERREMRKRCEKEGMRKARTVRQLMDSRKATLAALGVLVVTQVGLRAQRREQETEKQEKERDETWGLDEDRLEEDEEGNAKEEREDRERGEERWRE